MRLTEKSLIVLHVNAIFLRIRYCLTWQTSTSMTVRQVKLSFSISGVFLEQCEMFDPDLLETFKQLANTGCVEFLDQTYYHSIASLYPDKEEFIEQVKMHKQTIKDLLGYTPTIFENTELLYNNTIAKTVESLGYKGIYTEGVEKILGEKSPNYIYTPKGSKKIRVLLRNYKLNR